MATTTSVKSSKYYLKDGFPKVSACGRGMNRRRKVKALIKTL